MADFENIIKGLVECDEDQVMRLVKKSLDQGVSAQDILSHGLIAGMDIVGDKMENGDMFIPEVLRSAQIMSQAVEELKPLLSEDSNRAKGKVLIGTVQGDLHDIGKNLVSMMLESAGMEVHNLGVDISPDRFVEEIKDKKPNILCLSALLTTTMPMMKSTIEAIKKNGLRDNLSIMVGGAPVTQAFADEIGADGWAPDAGSATKLAKSLIN